MSRRDKKQFLMDKFRTFQVTVTEKNTYKFVLCIGEGANMRLVCRRGFARAYAVSHWYIEDIVIRLKKGEVNCLMDFNPTKGIIDINDKKLRQLSKFAEMYGISLNNDQMGSLKISQTTESLLCAAWMRYYFALVGDQVPNTDLEIHLEPVPKNNIYQEYLFDMQFLGENDADGNKVSLEVFRNIWNTVFPYVKVRKYKSSCGHCNLCAILSDKRRKFRDRSGREEVTNLFALHRMSTISQL
jgi:hypothetical protein